mmetsp:Transcript_9664/g.42178  ORF Transcript_9664/g.42178 Transcript_9664/m.42178 type:complete len:86 (+) Transcript_9664:33-290(+)
MSTRGQREAARSQAQILDGRVRHWEKKWTPAEGKNKSSVYKWVPATGELPGEDVESAPSERAKQFEAVPIGEVTLGMPQPPKPAT